MLFLDKIGIKSIKTALAVIISILIVDLLNFDSPYLTALTAVIGIQSTVYGSVSSAKNKIVGTFIGILIGIISVTYLPNNFIVISLSILVIIYICNILKLEGSLIQASIIYLSILLFPSPNITSISISIVIGVLVSIFINFLISPFEVSNNLYKSYHDLRESIFSLSTDIFTNAKSIDLNDFKSKMIEFKSMVEAYNNEYFKIKNKKISSDQIDILYGNIDGIKFFIYTIMELRKNDLSNRNIKRINGLLNVEIEVCDYENTRENHLFNFHVDKLLNYFEVIRSRD